MSSNLNLFDNIGQTCKNCNTCCRTYGWLLKDEAISISRKGHPTVKLNNKINCIDSFKRDKNGKIVCDKIPLCRFYKSNRCTIQKDKPLDCRLYPIKLIFEENKPVFVLSLGCKYISKLSKIELDNLTLKLQKRIAKIPKKTLKEYIQLMRSIDKVSKPKRFWMKKIY